MKLIVGLGNPGKKYLLTPHNIGWIVVDALAHYLNIPWHSKKKFSAQIAEQQKNLLVKPMTYMNLSGLTVKSVMNYYRLSIDDLLIIHDDIDLPFLSLRFQKNRGPAGHNGLRSINKELESQNYNRMRVGMKKIQTEKKEAAESSLSNNKNGEKEQWLPSSHSPMNIGLLTDYSSSEMQVLKPFTKKEQNLLPDFLNTTVEAIQYFLSEGLEKSANRYNSSSEQTTKK